jgi:tRNA 2-thiouridine synthesizing protein A
MGFAGIHTPFLQLHSKTNHPWELVSYALPARAIHNIHVLQDIPSLHPVALKKIGLQGMPMVSALADITLDVLGFHCPVPVHETKRVLQSMKQGEIIFVMADDPETQADIPALLNRTGDTLISFNEEAGEFHYRIQKE